MTIAELAAGAERLLVEVRALAALREFRDAAHALREARRLAVKFSPSGCRHCNLARHGHARQWTAEAGTHAWTPPTTDQIKARMLARRYGSAADAHDTNTEK